MSDDVGELMTAVGNRIRVYKRQTQLGAFRDASAPFHVRTETIGFQKFELLKGKNESEAAAVVADSKVAEVLTSSRPTRQRRVCHWYPRPFPISFDDFSPRICSVHIPGRKNAGIAATERNIGYSATRKLGSVSCGLL